MRARGLVRVFVTAIGALLASAAMAAAAPATVLPVASAARVGRAPAGKQLQLVLALRANLTSLKQLALAVSTPGNPLYRHYESIAQLAHQFGASRSDSAATLNYLRGVGATHLKLDATGLFVDATMRAATAERLFATTLTEFRGRQGLFTAPSSPTSIPKGLRGAVTGVAGLSTQPVAFDPSNFARNRVLHDRLATSGANGSAITPLAHTAALPASGYMPATGTPSGCAGAVQTGSFTPNQYLTAYNFTPLQSEGITGRGERVALIEIDGFKSSDITHYAECFGLRVPPITAFGVGGLRKPLSPGGETTLDLEVMTAAAPGLQEIDVYESSADEASALKALTSPLQNPGFKPQVISASLGLCEPFVKDAVGQRVLNNTEGALSMAAASGISFLDSSGDAGSADCTNNDGSPVPKLAVNYPTSSWWVTGVGGTNFTLNPDNTIASQVVWNDATLQPGSAGGGGVSLLWNTPPYQKGVISGNSRQVPDVAMLADVAPGYAIYCSAASACVSPSNPNPWQGIGGTSAATPLLAGGFAMIDQYLRQSQKQDLGLANPLLYQIGQNAAQAPTVFSDVTQGSNDVGPFITSSHTPLGCCTAVPGYDDASGWGSVNLTGFAAAALAIQPPIVGVSLSVPSGQRPLAAHKIVANVTCTGKCLAGAYATISVSSLRPVKVYSKLYPLSTAGSVSASIPITGALYRLLRLALRNGYHVSASVRGAILDAGGNIERQSSPTTIQITG
ncbi:MAG: S53 family peptidase [Solirubrobacteraceae bacterium]